MKIIRGQQLAFVPASHEDPRDPGCLKRVLAGQDDLIAGQVQMVNWSQLPVGRSFQSHYHEDMQEFFVLFDGLVRMLVNEQRIELAAGDAILIDPGEVHAMTNIGDRAANYLVFGISRQQGGRTIVV